jgi:outer membrane protein assembly factor BamB
MQLRKLLLPGLLSVTLLSGCSLFNSEEDVVKMSPLPTVENQFTPSTSWSTSVGDGIGDFILTCIRLCRRRCLCRRS